MNIKMLFPIIVGICIFCQAHAENMIMCVPPISGCTSTSASGLNWSMSCSSSGGTIKGIATCGHFTKTQNYNNYIITGTFDPENLTGTLMCACKLIYPVQSFWLYAGDIEYYRCQEYCASLCTSKIADGSIIFDSHSLMTDYSSAIDASR